MMSRWRMKPGLRAIVATIGVSLVGEAIGGGQGGVPEPFAIEVVDAETGRGVPLVELETVNNQRFVTDSNGLVAFLEPGLMGQSVYFHVRSHGYEFPADGFGYRGKALQVEPGGSARLVVRRLNIAERLYRVTGGGIYRDTALLGREAPIREPLLNARVLGQDSVLAEPYRGTIRWFWGDTNKVSYPLGNFHVPGATSLLPSDGGLDPEAGVDLTYFVGDDGFAKPTAKLPGEGPTWLGGLTVLRDAGGRERMFAGYAKIKPPLETYESGLVEWDDDAEAFRKVTQFEGLPPVHPTGHTLQRTEPDGTRHVYFTTPFPLTRAPADSEALADPGRYEGFTCLEAGTTFEDRRLDRGPDGRLRYAWKARTPPLDQAQQAELIKAGLMRPDEALLGLRDPDTGREVRAHGGTTYWNEYRKRWVAVFVEVMGEGSLLGELWYAEADTPLGPWAYARKVVTHDDYSFYNPKHHPFFDEDGGRVVFFEGTYTHSFSGNPVQTPRFDYNQVMYRLDLADHRLNLPVPVDHESVGARDGGHAPALFALGRPGDGTVPVYSVEDDQGGHSLVVGDPPTPDAIPAFHALPADLATPPPTTTPLYEFTRPDGAGRLYATSDAIEGYRRSELPLCLVWVDPVGVPIPDTGETLVDRGDKPQEARP
ncbi:hypothetical protein [Tautonia plasticadhaerens]|uniref:Uncharacterized protein n=1 Tax=Tautonia plasticadhaerens TaxID=2527974 RepID=A0A518HAI8_9BACT|nr:hypothetical protein [Tautonia plasticadhaerens]QDV37766.1 hypothetical protein ElP_57120 [Tautonia plasticadhaerens]